MRSLIRKALNFIVFVSILLSGLYPAFTARAALPAKTTFTFTYDASGNLASRTDANGAITTYQYDSLNHPLGIQYPDHTSVTFTYDTLGQRTQMKDSLGVTSYAYDIHGRLSKITDPNGNSVGYSYDPSGMLKRMVYPDGSAADYAWNPDGLLSSIHDSTGLTSYEYDAAGKPLKRTLPNGVVTQYEYDSANHRATIRHIGPDGKLLLEIKYQFDAAGNRTQMTLTGSDGAPHLTNYSYDTLTRLTKVVYPDGEEVTYTYDSTGNRTSLTSSKTGTTTYAYDGFG